MNRTDSNLREAHHIETCHPKIQSSKRSLPILDCPCIPFTSDEDAVRFLESCIKDGQGGYSVAINAEKILQYRDSKDVRDVINKARMPYADGFGAVLGLRWLHGAYAKKIYLHRNGLAAAEEKGWSVYVLGASKASNEGAIKYIRRQFPNLRLAGNLDGFVSEETMLSAVTAAKPDLVFLALGSPRQEILASKLSKILPGSFFIGCGGMLDVWAGNVALAPHFLRENGLEWLYRLIREPHRWRRQRRLPKFLAMVALAAVRKRFFRR